MLSCLRIENFALVDQLELKLGAGLIVLTGETGAGKSIILDAIDVVLGGKVNQRLIRTGAQRALIEIAFRADAALQAWFHEQGWELGNPDNVVCSREITLSKGSMRSRSRLNGSLVNRKVVEQLREHLVEITAQGQTMQLMVPAKQRELLDLYGGKAILRQRQVVAATYEKFKGAQEELAQRQQSEQERQQRLQWLQYQLEELDQVALEDPQELENLEQERDRLSHVVELQQLSYQAYQALYQNDGEQEAGADLLGQAENILTQMVSYDSQLTPVLDMVKGALMQIVEAGQQINAYGENLETDPQRLTQVEERISLLKQICRKYGSTLADAIAHYQKLKTELEQLTTYNQSLTELEKNYQACRQSFENTCVKLTALRQQAAQKLEHKLVKQLKPLAMDKVQFECRFTPCVANASGAEQVTYYFSPNPGEPLQPLSQTASGGEMSRFLLALKACFSQSEQTCQTLIFDEIDVGVSGKVAQAIAEKLYQLSKQHQVLCVTHQPLVAAMADVHFHVDKQIVDYVPAPSKQKVQKQQQNGAISPEATAIELLPEIRTVVRVQQLESHESRRQELAQLAGGKSATDAIAFADSLLTQASSYRQGS